MAPLNILVAVKRVPATGGRITLTADERSIDTRFLGFTISPHEECGVEEAVRIVEGGGGSSTVITLGPDEATEQLRDSLAVGVDRAVLLETDGSEWDPIATAAALVDAVREDAGAGTTYDLLLFGNEAPDTGDEQVGVRVAHALGLPCVTGVKAIAVGEGRVEARREGDEGWEVFDVPLPAVLTVREGLNLPRYPSVPGRLRARKKEVDRRTPMARNGGQSLRRLAVPPEPETGAEVLGTGVAAVPGVVELLDRLGLLR